MNTISMSKARKSIVTVYQRTWKRLTACSLGASPELNGPAGNGPAGPRSARAAA